MTVDRVPEIDQPGYTLIMVTRNRPDSLRKCLERTRAVLPPVVPIIVYDDASADEAGIRMIVESVNKARLLRGETVVGPGEGRNRCMHQAETEFCLSIDDDCFLNEAPDLTRWLEQRPEDRGIAAVGFRYFNVPEQSYAPDHAEAGPASAFHGGASLLRREAVLKAGGYLAWLVYACEDTELALRLRKLGYRIWYDPAVVVQHDHVATARDEDWATFYYVRNTYVMNVLQHGLIPGVPVGIARALRRGLYTSVPRRTFAGLLAGLRMSRFCLRERRRLFEASKRCPIATTGRPFGANSP
jgi:GT2 family glycosyltransferase